MPKVNIQKSQIEELRKNHPNLAAASDEVVVSYAIARYNYQQDCAARQPRLPKVK